MNDQDDLKLTPLHLFCNKNQKKTNDVAHKGSSSFDWDSVLEKERAQHEIGKYSNRINKILSIR